MIGLVALLLPGCHWFARLHPIQNPPMGGRWEGTGSFAMDPGPAMPVRALLHHDVEGVIIGALTTPRPVPPERDANGAFIPDRPYPLPPEQADRPTRWLVLGANAIDEGAAEKNQGPRGDRATLRLTSRTHFTLSTGPFGEEITTQRPYYGEATSSHAAGERDRLRIAVAEWGADHLAGDFRLESVPGALTGAATAEGFGKYIAGGGKVAGAFPDRATAASIRNDPELEREVLKASPFVTDDRFSGKYYLAERTGDGSWVASPGRTLTWDQTFVKSDLLGWLEYGPFTAKVSARLEALTFSLQHFGAEEPDFAGIVLGHGEATMTGSGRRSNGFIGLAGEVTSRGRMVAMLGTELGHERNIPTLTQGLLSFYEFEAALGFVDLQDDGMTLRLDFLGNELHLRKDVGPNTPPKVRILRPADGATFRWDQPISLTADVDDTETRTEDGSAADLSRMLRLDWTSETPQGSSRRPVGKTLSLAGIGIPILMPRTSVLWSDASPGDYVLTFTAVDPGGLSATASVRIRRLDRKPVVPTILEPAEGLPLCLGGTYVFKATGFSAQDGAAEYDGTGQHLSGARLLWSDDLEDWTAGGLHEGMVITRRLTKPGLHTISVRTVDSKGQASEPAVRTFQVDDCGSNKAPRVTLSGPDTVAVTREEGKLVPVTLDVRISDDEQSWTTLQTRWEVTGPPGAPLPANPVRTGTGLASQTFEFGPLASPDFFIYDVKVTVTDAGGRSAAVAGRLWVYRNGFTIP